MKEVAVFFSRRLLLAVILGIDPGSRITGFGLLNANSKGVEHISHGIILLPKDESLPLRLKVLAEGMQTLLAKYKPTQVVVEKIFLGKNADSAFKLGHARGVVLAEAAKFGAEVHEYATRVVKKAIAGKGSAEKEQVKFMVEKLLGIDQIEKIDASDALAMALYHANHHSLSQKLRQSEEKQSKTRKDNREVQP
jgi:crossover junction endodeoxyribonuclease RuvC